MWRWGCDCPFFFKSASCLGGFFVWETLIFARLSVSSRRPRCRCERYVSAEELCNATCLSRLPRILGRFSRDGRLLLSLGERDGVIWVRDK